MPLTKPEEKNTHEQAVQRGRQGRAPRGGAQPASGPTPHPTSTSQVSSDAQTWTRHVCKVLICHQLLSFGQKPPRVPIGSGTGGVPGLCAGVRPLAPAAPQLSTGGLLSACDSISRVTPLGQRHRVPKWTRQGPRNPESLGAGAGQAVGCPQGQRSRLPFCSRLTSH